MIEQERPFVVAIDGPSGAGKGTLSQLVAKQLRFHLLDSGALYRIVALSALNAAVDLADENAVASIAKSLDVTFDVSGNGTTIVLAGENVTDAIRQERVGMAASVVAALPKVRFALLERQKAFAQSPGLVADGRDMGTTVFPDAQVKIFLTASAEARAQRRFKQLTDKGEQVDMLALIQDIQDRDDRDANRSTSPLRPAADALHIDSTSLSIEQVLFQILQQVECHTSV